MPQHRTRGRPPAGTTAINLRLPRPLLDALDAYRLGSGQVSRPEAIRRILTESLILSSDARGMMNAANSDLSDCIVAPDNFLDAANAVRCGAGQVTYGDFDGDVDLVVVPVGWVQKARR